MDGSSAFIGGQCLLVFAKESANHLCGGFAGTKFRDSAIENGRREIRMRRTETGRLGISGICEPRP
jgi:hypothetical protein